MHTVMWCGGGELDVPPVIMLLLGQAAVNSLNDHCLACRAGVAGVRIGGETTYGSVNSALL